MFQKLLSILACPNCKGEIKLGPNLLSCESCALTYGISDGIPDLVPPRTGDALTDSILEENVKLHTSEAKYYEIQHYVAFTLQEQKRLRDVFYALRAECGVGERVLDLAAGTGNLTRHLNACGFDTVSADLSLEMLKQIPFDVPKVRCDALRLPFLDQSFGLITAYSTLHHLPNASAAVIELARVAKRRSIIYIDHDPFFGRSSTFKRSNKAFLSFLLWSMNKPKYYSQTIEYLLFGRAEHRSFVRNIDFRLTDGNVFNTDELTLTFENLGYSVKYVTHDTGCYLLAVRG